MREELPQDKSDALGLLVSVSKLADFLITLQTEDFQMCVCLLISHQWLLITDTSDSIYPLPDWESDSLLDCISKTLDTSGSTVPRVEAGALRRPFIQESRITSVRDLQSFFASASPCFYQNAYASAQLDWDNMNMCLMRDIFDPDRIVEK